MTTRRRQSPGLGRVHAVLAMLLLLLLLLGAAREPIRAGEQFDWDLWRALPVQQGGRQKPLDTVARQSLRQWANLGSVVDPDTQERLDPTALYVTMLLDWKGWDHPDRGHLRRSVQWQSFYFPLHVADRWDRLPLLRIENPILRSALNQQIDGNLATPEQLSQALVQDYRQNREVPFTVWAEGLRMREQNGQELAEIERDGLTVAQRLWSYQNHRMGHALAVLPDPDEETAPWTPLAQLLLEPADDAAPEKPAANEIRDSFHAAQRALHDNDPHAFNAASRRLVDSLQSLGESADGYPEPGMIRLEVAYNQWSPFRIAWILMLVAALCGSADALAGATWLRRTAMVAYLGGVGAMIAGFVARGLIAGRPPVTNMYESIVFVGAGVALLGLVFAVLDRRPTFVTTAAIISTVALILADSAPLILDPNLQPLEPALRSNFWLTTHVLTVTLSYAALALALGLGNAALGYCLVRSQNQTAVATLGRLTYKVLQVGVLLLAVGIFLGGVWADYSWGRFWGWDPKEVWALVALLGYLAVLHARYAGWLGDRGLAALAVVCFVLVVMGWYGVNYVLGVGLHTYGFGGGGQQVVYGLVVLQLVYVAIAVLRMPDDPGQQQAIQASSMPAVRLGSRP